MNTRTELEDQLVKLDQQIARLQGAVLVLEAARKKVQLDLERLDRTERERKAAEAAARRVTREANAARRREAREAALRQRMAKERARIMAERAERFDTTPWSDADEQALRERFSGEEARAR